MSSGARLVAAACLILATAGFAAAETAVLMPGMTLEQQISAWLQANIDQEGDASFLGKIEAFMLDNVKQKKDVILEMGPNTMKSGSAVVVSVFDGRLFSSHLSEEQAMSILEGPGSVTARTFESNYTVADEPAFAIGLPTVGAGTTVRGADKMTGKIAVRVGPNAPEKYAVRMVVRIETSTTQRFSWVENPPASGLQLVDFSYDPLHEEGEDQYTGPLLLGFDICTIKENYDGVDIVSHSNPVMVLVDVK